VPAFIILYFGKNFMQNFVSSIPDYVSHYLTVVGGMLPALGIAILLNMIIKKKMFYGVFLIGFILSVYLKLPIIPIAAIGAVIAIFWYHFSSRKEVEYDGGK
jgi:PTS system mannose-specific IIC component